MTKGNGNLVAAGSSIEETMHQGLSLKFILIRMTADRAAGHQELEKTLLNNYLCIPI